MQSIANRLAMQHFVNAYTQETGKGQLLNNKQQNLQQQTFSQGLTLLSIPINAIQAQCNFPLSYVSRVGRHLLFGDKSIFAQGFLRATVRLLNFYIFEHSNAKKIVGEPDHTVTPYAAIAEELCYERQYLIEMPEKIAMLYYCYRERFYQKFAEYYYISQRQLTE